MAFELRDEERGTVVVITVTGDLDAPERSRQLIALFRRHFEQGQRSFVLDLSGARRLKIKGASAILDMHKKCRGCGRTRLVLGTNVQVRRMLDQLGWLGLFATFEDLKAALESFEPVGAAA